jgi:hypothetical protein
MASQPLRPRSRNEDNELWFSMSSNTRREQPHIQDLDHTAYQAMSNRHMVQRPASPSRFHTIPSISTTIAVNKPLPPPPKDDQKKRKAGLHSLLRRKPSDQAVSSHLQPQPYAHHQRSSSANGNLTPEPYPNYYLSQSSRSTPVSPIESGRVSYQAVPLARAHSASAHYTDTEEYIPYQQSYENERHRSVSMNTYFEPQPPRARRTFPESNAPSSASPRDLMSGRPRPHTWLSPTEPNAPFDDASDFHLFVEATSGLPPGALDFDGFSPGSPSLQGSLFARGSRNDSIPILLSNPTSTVRPHSAQPIGWQSMDYEYMPSQSTMSPLVSSSALPLREPQPQSQSQMPPHLNAINLELERLGLNEDVPPEDELPDYAQSQAEMNAKKRTAATNRARELEARWNSSRGGRSQ